MRKAKAIAKNLSEKSQAFPLDSKLDYQASVIKEKQLDSILNVSKGQKKVKTVPRLLAQYAIECETYTVPGWDAKRLQVKYLQIKEYDERVAVIFDIQFSGGCRISEVLNVMGSDIDNFGKVTVRGLKGGHTRIVQSMFSQNWLVGYIGANYSPFNGLDRFYVYRAYKRFGISEHYGGNKRASVTHLPRHEVALASKEINRDDETTKAQLGQKSVKSTAHYTGKRRGKGRK